MEDNINKSENLIIDTMTTYVNVFSNVLSSIDSKQILDNSEKVLLQLSDLLGNILYVSDSIKKISDLCLNYISTLNFHSIDIKETSEFAKKLADYGLTLELFNILKLDAEKFR